MDTINKFRQLVGLPYTSCTEEVVVPRTVRTEQFAVEEIQHLAGVRDYRSYGVPTKKVLPKVAATEAIEESKDEWAGLLNATIDAQRAVNTAISQLQDLEVQYKQLPDGPPGLQAQHSLAKEATVRLQAVEQQLRKMLIQTAKWRASSRQR